MLKIGRKYPCTFCCSRNIKNGRKIPFAFLASFENQRKMIKLLFWMLKNGREISFAFCCSKRNIKIGLFLWQALKSSEENVQKLIFQALKIVRKISPCFWLCKKTIKWFVILASFKIRGICPKAKFSITKNW